MEKIDDDVFVLAFGDIIVPAEFYKSLMDTYIMTEETSRLYRWYQ